MPRPTRIEYENAVYHVMNRGRGRRTIFHGESYYRAFLHTLAEAHRRFDALIHAYCLLGNHYHLLIQTPRANLGRIMRYINGLYTQRYNRLLATDGPLFRVPMGSGMHYCIIQKNRCSSMSRQFRS